MHPRGPQQDEGLPVKQGPGKGLEDDGMISELNSEQKSEGIRAVPFARWKARREGIDLSRVRGTGPRGIILAKDLDDSTIGPERMEAMSSPHSVYASTLAKNLAVKEGLSLENIMGTGTRGRIMMGDVIKTLEEKTPPVEDKKIPVRGKGLFGQTLPMTQMRKVIARKMAQSAFTAPHIYFVTEVDMNELLLFKDKVQGDFEKEFQVRISINDFVIKATALTIRDFPLLNAMMKGEEIYVMPEINIGLAVAMEEGLIVPAIPHADELGLDEIAKIRANLVERARGGKLKMEEIERGTFTISSLAQYDITFFTAILNPPQSGILSIGKTREFKEETGMKKIASFGLSVDHRVINGVVAATFLQSLKKRLENPYFTFMQLRR